MSCSRRFFFETLHEIIQVDTFVEKGSERLKTDFFQLSRLPKFEFKTLETKSVVECIVSKLLYIDLRILKQKCL